MVVNVIYIRTFCDHLNVRNIFDPTCIVLKSDPLRLSLTLSASPSIRDCLECCHRAVYHSDPKCNEFLNSIIM